VLQVCPYDIARPGGVQRHVLDLSNALVRAGHEMTIVAPAGADPSGLDSRVTLIRVGRARAWRMHGTRFEVTRASRGELDRVERLARAQRFDAAYFHAIWTPFMPWQVFRRVRGLVGRNIAMFHDTPPPGVSGALTRVLFGMLSRRLSRRLDVMIAVSSAPARHLRVVGGARLVLLPACIDLAPYASIARESGAEGCTVLFVGRLEPRKGVLLLVEAFSRVKAAERRARLVICGDGEQRADAEALAARLNVADEVTFTGALSDTERLALYARADVFCAPSPFGESYGLVIAEAMAAGLPVVAAANPGYRTVLAGTGAAGLVKPGEIADLAERLVQLLGSRELRTSLSVWGRECAWRSDVSARLPEFLELFAPAPATPARNDSTPDTSARAYAARN
jgi:phosphatidylinositol alpha-mannosyltransferase